MKMRLPVFITMLWGGLTIAAERSPDRSEPDPIQLLQTVLEARQQIDSGQLRFDVYRSFSHRPMEGTNHIRLEMVFFKELRLSEQVGREYTYVLHGAEAGEVSRAKIEELNLNKREAVDAGLITGFESRYVTIHDGDAWMFLNATDARFRDRAMELLEQHHTESPDIFRLCEQLVKTDGYDSVPLLRTILRDNSDRLVRAHASFALASKLAMQSEVTGDLQLRREAQSLLQNVLNEYRAEAEVDDGDLADKAASKLQLLNRLGVGMKAPETVGVDLDGNEMRLSDYRGKVVVLNFWGAWCPPCMAMIPEERELVRQMDGKPFALIGVNSDTDEQRMRNAIEKEEITWPSFRDGSRGPISELWSVQSWPTTFLIDEDGIIRHRMTGETELIDLVTEFMANR